MIKFDFIKITGKKYNFFQVVALFLSMAGFRALVLHRLSHFFFKNNYLIGSKILIRVMRFSCGIDIEPGAIIGLGLKIPHSIAIVIGGKSIIGDGCQIMQGVTIGGSMGKKNDFGITQPILEDGVFVGPGAKILGPVRVGRNAIVGANAVVVRDVMSNDIVAGVPAKSIKKSND